MFLFKFDTTLDPICGGEVKRIDGRKIFSDHNFKHVIKLSIFSSNFTMSNQTLTEKNCRYSNDRNFVKKNRTADFILKGEISVFLYIFLN